MAARECVGVEQRAEGLLHSLLMFDGGSPIDATHTVKAVCVHGLATEKMSDGAKEADVIMRP